MKMSVELTCGCGNNNKYDIRALSEDSFEFSSTIDDDDYFQSECEPSGLYIKCLKCDKCIDVF